MTIYSSPHQGTQLRKRTVALALVMLLTAAACGQTTSTEPNSEDTATTTVEEASSTTDSTDTTTTAAFVVKPMMHKPGSQHSRPRYGRTTGSPSMSTAL